MSTIAIVKRLPWQSVLVGFALGVILWGTRPPTWAPAPWRWAYAKANHYYWLPCKGCDRMHGGYESSGWARTGTASTDFDGELMTSDGKPFVITSATGVSVCDRCKAVCGGYDPWDLEHMTLDELRARRVSR